MTSVRQRRFFEVGELPEIELPRGDVTEGVVRVGDTVRRPHQAQSWAVAAYLDHLESVGFDASPRFLGIDDRGRDVLTFLEGDVAGDILPAWALADELLVSVGTFVRRLHHASAGYVPVEPFPLQVIQQDPFELVAHLDVTPQNVVVRDGSVVGILDFDLAGPSTRLIDTVNTAQHWVPVRAPQDLTAETAHVDILARLRLFADAYGWTTSERESIPTLGSERATLSWRRMKFRAETLGGGWARMWNAGVGDAIARRGQWYRDNSAAIVTALTRESSPASVPRL